MGGHDGKTVARPNSPQNNAGAKTRGSKNPLLPGAKRPRATRRVRWLRDALAPARERMDEESFERLVAAMCLCVGIESLVVLRDVCGLEAEEAEEVARWAAFALLGASLNEGESPDSGSSRRSQNTS